MSTSTIYALKASSEALEDAKWAPSSPEEEFYTGWQLFVIFWCLLRFFSKFSSKCPPGINISFSTAFATGGHSIGAGYRYIKQGMAKVILAGSSDASLCPWMMSAFCKVRSLSTEENLAPSECSRPFDSKRSGFVMSEGSACLVLEDLDHALSRNVKIYAEILGYGTSSDANSLTAPCSDGDGALRSMKNALKEGNVDPSSVGYVNAHATGTILGDRAENSAIGRLFDPSLTKKIEFPVSKSVVGKCVNMLVWFPEEDSGKSQACFIPNRQRFTTPNEGSFLANERSFHVHEPSTTRHFICGLVRQNHIFNQAMARLSFLQSDYIEALKYIKLAISQIPSGIKSKYIPRGEQLA
ncbi:3-oxoacyl-[acyl-carrier-protein] synthase, mitochondrial-like [Octopus sinensis]|uniref:beta-ketoacyl-[acyl-carrier-protein] synthase I n=1 Tax=Octopus sinensis TaxID=2607531 RepID=A0A6P7U023_9MOLL|nr:3-oxoacyl-[acyl-carrier-protein] synthase, mitochondrial-like [Octopus sinensis]